LRDVGGCVDADERTTPDAPGATVEADDDGVTGADAASAADNGIDLRRRGTTRSRGEGDAVAGGVALDVA
jgi:hypothetical protein